MRPAPRVTSHHQLLDRADWKFRRADETAWHSSTLPGCVSADRHRLGVVPDPFHGVNEHALRWIEEVDWVYAAEFTADADLENHEHLDLVCGGLDTVATVTLNGHEVARTDN